MNTSELYSTLRLKAQGCPNFTYDVVINQAVREFCNASWFCRRSGIIQLVDGVQYYFIEFPLNNDDEEIIGVKAVEYNGIPLVGYTPEQIKQGWEAYGYIFYPPNKLEFLIKADATKQIKINCPITVVIDSKYIPDDLNPTHLQTITDGALYKLLSMPEEKWTNFQLSSYYERRYNAGMNMAKSSAMFGHVTETYMQPNSWYI